MSCQTAETKVYFNIIIDRQRQNVESILVIDDCTICLRSETDHQIHVEEANFVNIFGKRFELFDLFLFGSFLKIKRNSRHSFSNINELKRKIKALDCRVLSW
jgi:hypothetical protein